MLLITVKFFFSVVIIQLNSDHGIGCVYSPLGLVIFVAVEGTFVCFTAIYVHIFEILYASLVVLLLYQTGTNRETNSDYNQNGKTCALI